MSDTEVLDKTFHFILKRMVDTGQAPHYTEIEAELGVSPEDGRQTMHKLFNSRVYGWLFPGKKVRIDSPCLDCGEPISIEMRDGIIEKVEPEGVIGHVALPVSQWMADIPYA